MSPDISRRRFIEGMAALTGVALVGCSSQEQTPAPGGPGAPGLQATAGANGGFEVANTGNLTAGQGVDFVFPDGKPGLLFVGKDGKAGAVSAVCPHMNCTVTWRPENSTTPIVCPCHNSSFNTAGKVQGGPAKTDLAYYTVSLSGGNATLKPS